MVGTIVVPLAGGLRDPPTSHSVEHLRHLRKGEIRIATLEHIQRLTDRRSVGREANRGAGVECELTSHWGESLSVCLRQSYPISPSKTLSRRPDVKLSTPAQ